MSDEPTDPSRDLGPEQRPGDGTEPPPSELARVGSLPATNEVVDAALRLVVGLAEATVHGANGVSVSLERHGKLRTVAASNATILEMDRHQYESGEGPCVAAAAEGRWFHIESLADETRWPTFVPEAMQQGIKSILSTPLVPGDRPVGALNIYSNAEHAFGTTEQGLAQLFATQASGILADAGAAVAEDERTALLTESLRSREVIAMACGILMARSGISQEAAAAALRRAARDAQTTVRQHAEEIVRSTPRRATPGPSDG